MVHPERFERPAASRLVIQKPPLPEQLQPYHASERLENRPKLQQLESRLANAPRSKVKQSRLGHAKWPVLN